MKELFRKYDKNGDGTITKNEVASVVQDVCSEFKYVPATQVELDRLLKKADKDGDGVLSFAEFISFIKGMRSLEIRLKLLFDRFDKDRNGTIDKREFKVFR